MRGGIGARTYPPRISVSIVGGSSLKSSDVLWSVYIINYIINSAQKNKKFRTRKFENENWWLIKTLVMYVLKEEANNSCFVTFMTVTFRNSKIILKTNVLSV